MSLSNNLDTKCVKAATPAITTAISTDNVTAAATNIIVIATTRTNSFAVVAAAATVFLYFYPSVLELNEKVILDNVQTGYWKPGSFMSLLL